jgi:hypothetical protein
MRIYQFSNSVQDLALQQPPEYHHLLQTGKHEVRVSLVESDPAKSSLKAITFTPVR